MSLKTKLYSLCFFLHLILLGIALAFNQEFGVLLLVIELVLALSLITFIWLIRKALQPLEYIHIFSSLLKENEFSSRFSHLKQADLDQLISQFNIMLQRLQNKQLELSKQKGVFEKLMDESPIGVILLNFDGHISDINTAACKLLSINKTQIEQIIGHTIKQCNQGAIAYLQEVEISSHKLITLNNGQRIKIGHYIIRDRGFERSFYLLYELTGDIIQSQRSAYEKLIRLMSHEVNNTIAITNSLLESSLSFKEQLDNSASEDFEESINIVINRCASLNLFMQGYAEVVKLPHPVKANFNFTLLIKNLSKLFYAECRKRQITMELDLTGDFLIFADAHLIEQALVNIIKNAIEAIGENGRITIQMTPENDHINVSIRDTGEGLSKEVERQLFTPFYTTKESGQGIGLMLIHEILDLHDYDYQLANNKNAVGAAFNIVIPLNPSTDK